MKTKEFRIIVVVKNNLLWNAMIGAGYKTAVSLSRFCGVSLSTIYAYLSLARCPYARYGKNQDNWRISNSAATLSAFLEKPLKELFPEEFLIRSLDKNKKIIEASSEELKNLIMLPELFMSQYNLDAARPLDDVSNNPIDMDTLFKVLTANQETVIRKTFGIEVKEQNYDEIAQDWGVSSERIRQIQKSAIRRLQLAAGLSFH